MLIKITTINVYVIAENVEPVNRISSLGSDPPASEHTEKTTFGMEPHKGPERPSAPIETGMREKGRYANPQHSYHHFDEYRRAPSPTDKLIFIPKNQY